MNCVRMNCVRMNRIRVNCVHMVCLALFAFLSGCSAPTAQLIANGNRAVAQTDYVAAHQQYQAALETNRQPGVALYNLAGVYYRQGEYQIAEQALRVAMLDAPTALTALGAYNLGNALFLQERYADAATAYKDSLRLNPADEDAKVNLELALLKLAQQTVEPTPQGPPTEEPTSAPTATPAAGATPAELEKQEQETLGTPTAETAQGQSDGGAQPAATEPPSDPSTGPAAPPTAGPTERSNESGQSEGAPTAANDGPGATPTPGAGGAEAAADGVPTLQPPLTPDAELTVADAAMSARQAAQLLEAATQGTKSLQQSLQQNYEIPFAPLEEDW